MRKNRFKEIGNKGLIGRFLEDKVIELKLWKSIIILILMIIGVIFLVTHFVRSLEKSEQDFKKFLKAEKAGVFQGVTMAPEADRNTYKSNGRWLVDVKEESK